ncbi:hypothetical protein ACEOWJ_003876 [Bacillus cereus]|uniref:hypothetical protein n=1 Tax=Bacillus TaxID=1386 RepID=UPI00054DDD81|nr:hypothetical protein [Bacillus sp. UNC322MFChir4.1]
MEHSTLITIYALIFISVTGRIMLSKMSRGAKLLSIIGFILFCLIGFPLIIIYLYTYLPSSLGGRQ